MKEWFQKLVGGQAGPYLQALAVLLVAIGLIGVALSMTGCDGCADSADTALLDLVRRDKPRAIAVTASSHSPSHPALRAAGQTTGPPFPATATLTWQPPQGATNVQYDPAPAPGGPPYQWNLEVQGDGSTPWIEVRYDWPPGSTNPSVDTFTVIQPDGAQSSTTIPSGSMSRAAARSPDPSAPDRAAPAQDYFLWQIDYWVWTEEVTLTTALCQQWAGFPQEDTAFVAVRFPVYPPTQVYTAPYTLPVVMEAPYAPALSLGGQLTVPLEYKPERFTFLENKLPAAPGEHWLALGAVTTPTIVCPADLNMPGGSWHLQTRLYLDLGGGPDTFANHVLPVYYCYEGQSLPEALLPAGRAAGRQLAAMAATSYQGWGITCVGPRAMRLESTGAPVPPFSIQGRHVAEITPTQTITFHHYVRNLAGEPLTLTLSTASALGLPWGIYSGTASAPDLPLVPITAPLRLDGTWPGSRRDLWLIVTVPPGTPSGAETLIITATHTLSPTLFDWTTDGLWVGDWVAPPLPPWSRHRIYLPLVQRGP